jgi:hypothetical protein
MALYIIYIQKKRERERDDWRRTEGKRKRGEMKKKNIKNVEESKS